MPTLHLFSTFDREDIYEACRPYLERKNEPVVAFLPLASLYAERWQEFTQEMFKRLARVETFNAELTTLSEMEGILRRAALVYITGGNAFLLAHRLHVSGLMPYLKKKVQAGLPVVAFSAGSILCGPNILTSRDMNTVATSYFDGLDVTPFNFKPHYPEDARGQSEMDDWLADYFFFHDNPILLLSDRASVKVDGKKTTLVRGPAWILRPNEEKQGLEEGQPISLHPNA
jgi:peptidase E